MIDLRPSQEVMQASADAVLSLQDVVGYHFWFCPQYRTPSGECMCGMEALRESRARARAEVEHCQNTEALNDNDPVVLITKIRARIRMLTHRYWQAHYGDDDVKASEIRCEIEELQSQLDR